eukprot:gene15298-15440_t
MVCITRGGLVPAAIVARELGIRMIETVCIASYHDYKNQSGLQVIKGIADAAAGINHQGGKVLVVDDLVDTGSTFRVVREMLPNAHYATVYAKPLGRPLVDTFITEFPATDRQGYGRLMEPRIVTFGEPPGVKFGITEAQLHDLVHGFYDKIRGDSVLGPIFNAEINDWAPHLTKMCDFWSSVILMSGRYHGRPVPAHLKIPRLTAEHFTHWLELFRATAHELFHDDAAALLIDRAERIAQSLQMMIAFKKGELPPTKA